MGQCRAREPHQRHQSCVRLRRLFGRQLQLLGQCRVREPHQRHQLFSYSSALRASTLAFGSRSSSRASFSLSIIPRLRLIGCHLQLLGVKNTLFLELHWRHRLSSSSARRASPSASGSKSSSRNSSTSRIVHRRRSIGCHPNHLCQVLFVFSLRASRRLQTSLRRQRRTHGVGFLAASV